MVNYLPWFQMYDSWVTREITVRDLLVHRSGLGLGAGDLLWWPASTYTRAEIVRRLRYIKPATSFRSAYAYDNVLYLVAGQLIEAVSGQTLGGVRRPTGSSAGGHDGRATRTHPPPATRSGNVSDRTRGRRHGAGHQAGLTECRTPNPAGGINAGAQRHGEVDDRADGLRASGRQAALYSSAHGARSCGAS